ncbi:O-antigen ligase family protein [Sporosalibacterium faouarense]|uniref:O-antigen ligase family protein n=1 Tax=Sporosalibacterium faouarense TaxID=516123 RepID=UPI00141C18E6|nr:O-antigen ligase family protein [Sporosalibacterium faouarense]MTI49830.1 hypothetical protein [Bacillota bacterium]
MKRLSSEKTIKLTIYSLLIVVGLFPLLSFIPLVFLLLFIVRFNEGEFIIKDIMSRKELILLTISMIASSIVSELWYISIFFTILFIMKMVFIILVGRYIKEKDMNEVIIIILGLGFIVSIIGLIQFITGIGGMPDSWIDQGTYTINFRVFSTFYNPNILSAFLNLVIITGFTVTIYLENNRLKIYSYATVAIALTSLLLTYSRGGWISLCIALGIASLYEKSYIKYTFIVVMALVCFDYFTEAGRLSANKLLTDSSISYRLEVWKASVKIIKENILLGIGKGTSWYEIHTYSDKITWYVSHAHNLYLQILVEGGVIGLGAYVYLSRLIWKKIKLEAFNNTSNRNIISTISFIFFVSLLIYGIVDAVPLLEQIDVFIWLLVGINLGNKAPHMNMKSAEV